MVTFKEFKEIVRIIEYTENDKIDYARILNNLAIRIHEDAVGAEKMGCPITSKKCEDKWEIITHFLLSKGYYDNI